MTIIYWRDDEAAPQTIEHDEKPHYHKRDGYDKFNSAILACAFVAAAGAAIFTGYLA